MDQRVKAKGRAVSALRIGLRQAREDLVKAGYRKAAEDCNKAIRRSERLERG